MVRRNFQIDLNRPGSSRCSYGTCGRNPSFDEDPHQYYNVNYKNHSNIYEQINDDPIYRKAKVSNPNSRVMGKLNVIGHGVGRIERHLSSSCGNIDHYNLGGHDYAVLGHSHYGTVGHIRLNSSSTTTTTTTAQQKDSGVKTSTSFFSCISGDNAQSISSINRSSSETTTTTSSTTARCTGAIPKSKIASNQLASKMKAKPALPNRSQSPENCSTLNRISKNSLQWLLVNRWMPLWISQGSDCKIIDFNFMFSRNCGECEYENVVGPERPRVLPFSQDLVRYRRDRLFKPIKSTLNKLKETEKPESNYENVHVQFQNFEFGRSREDRPTLTRARSESPTFSQRLKRQQNHHVKFPDPFKNYELNTENNSFKPKALQAKIQKVEPSEKPVDPIEIVEEEGAVGGIDFVEAPEDQPSTETEPNDKNDN